MGDDQGKNTVPQELQTLVVRRGLVLRDV